MPFKIVHNKQSAYLTVQVEGVFNQEEFVKILDAIVKSNEYPENINAIYDLSNMFFEKISSDFLYTLSLLAEKYSKQRSGAKTALVCPADLQFGAAREWDAYTDHIPVDKTVVRTMEEAIKWVKNAD
ncbi:hypothetical protein UWK_02859 [Desulfocapsa sulfexigens DSM 10523]|uniref:STAS/SEC14 domain-containing protein n=1 Tax=Desulfocapsa sulfexigens (strain DSM 10523 / SB164P1) TaxID=1167006 RepID=M1PIG9_DESSD|nr:hypothetical protein [Desulfocapsa sulfexigens]AGF79390.1 hypothetical protein UWK_02859 [Desulfocapsa sulfexigens DSM 10523]